jgi:gamma-glutamyltranspeptidase/glutathione hydrolase
VRIVVAMLVVLLLAGEARARSGAVAAEHAAAAEAGAAMLRAGGTVVDAAIAAAATVCVVHASSCGVGGGGFAVMRVDDTLAALDYREVAPQGATPERYLRDGRPDPTRTRAGGLAVAVPGEVAGWIALHARFGTLPLARVLAPAVTLAKRGFALADAPHLHGQIARHLALLRADPGLRATFLDARGDVPLPAARIVQRELAATLARIGREGWAGFAAAAPAIAAAVQRRGGVMTAAEVRRYRPTWRSPLIAFFRGRRIVTFPPPGSGGVVLTMLGMLGEDDLGTMAPGARAHLLAGAMAQGFADRAAWYGDTQVPVWSLLDPARLRALRARIHPDRVTAPIADLIADAGTTHLSVVDAAGNAVAMTTTINTAFGAGIVVPGTGIVLNNEMDDFALPGAANAFGLDGATANAIAPGKRPQSSMSPTLVLDADRPELVVGGSGGPLIITGVVQTILAVTALGLDVATAVAAPRIHDQGRPPALAVEPAVPEDVRAALRAVGHVVAEMPALGAVAAVGIDRDRRLVGTGDPRKDGGFVIVP